MACITSTIAPILFLDTSLTQSLGSLNFMCTQVLAFPHSKSSYLKISPFAYHILVHYLYSVSKSQIHIKGIAGIFSCCRCCFLFSIHNCMLLALFRNTYNIHVHVCFSRVYFEVVLKPGVQCDMKLKKIIMHSVADLACFKIHQSCGSQF